MEKTQKIIVVLLIMAIVFSVVSTILNLSLINLEFQPVNIQIPSNVIGNNIGNVGLTVEKPVSGGLE